MAVLQINGTTVKTPKEMTWSLQDISGENDGRNQNGEMNKTRIAQKVKLVCKWGVMTTAESAVLLQAVNAAVNFPVTYLDPMANAYLTKTFYVGDRTSPKLWETSESTKVESVSFDFIEV